MTEVRKRLGARLLRFSGLGLLLDGELLVDGVGRRGRGLLDLLEQDDVRVLIALFRGAALDDAVGYDGENPEHAEENADATAQDEGDGAALPETEVHEGEVETRDEASTVVGAEGASVVGATVVADMMRTIMGAIHGGV